MASKIDQTPMGDAVLPPSGPLLFPLTESPDYPAHIRFRPPPVILTPRLLLRYATERDIPAIHTFLSNEDTMKHMGSKVSLSLADSEQWYKARFVKDPVTGSGGGEFIYLICLRDGDTEGEPVGTSGSRQAPHLGYQVGAGPKYWGKGYGTEAVGAVVNAILQTIRAEKQEGWEDAYVKIRIDEGNIGSIRVAEKIGAKRFEGGDEGVEDGTLIIEYRCHIRDTMA